MSFRKLDARRRSFRLRFVFLLSESRMVNIKSNGSDTERTSSTVVPVAVATNDSSSRDTKLKTFDNRFEEGSPRRLMGGIDLLCCSPSARVVSGVDAKRPNRVKQSHGSLFIFTRFPALAASSVAFDFQCRSVGVDSLELVPATNARCDSLP